jgi:hypothetical protein
MGGKFGEVLHAKSECGIYLDRIGRFYNLPRPEKPDRGTAGLLLGISAFHLPLKHHHHRHRANKLTMSLDRVDPNS